MEATVLFDNDLTQLHVLRPAETADLEVIAEKILLETDTTTLSVPEFENTTDRSGLRHTLWSATLSLHMDDAIEPYYPPPHSYHDLGGLRLQRGKDHPLYVFEEIGLLTNENLVEYKHVMGQLIESVERMAMKGIAIMGKDSSICDLFNPPKDIEDEKKRLKTMQGSVEGKRLMKEHGFSRYHSILGFLAKYSKKAATSFAKSEEAVSQAWDDYLVTRVVHSDERFAQFMSDYKDDLERATECMKLVYSMTKQILEIVDDKDSYRRIKSSADMALHPKPYNKAIAKGIKHLKLVDKTISSYVVEEHTN